MLLFVALLTGSSQVPLFGAMNEICNIAFTCGDDPMMMPTMVVSRLESVRR